RSDLTAAAAAVRKRCQAGLGTHRCNWTRHSCGRCNTIHGAATWRKVAGVEPTGKRLTSPTGFEARPHHRMRMPSEFAVDALASVGSVLVVPTAVDTQPPRIACAASIANAVEELQNLGRALAPYSDG